VARDCPAYSDVMANRARNNIMETLQDLGKDSVYTGGQAVDPSIEEPNDPNCKPLNGWQFQIGSDYGKSGQLSHVTGSPLIITGDTKSNVPVLNPDGTSSGKTSTKGSWTFVSFTCSEGSYTRSGDHNVTIHLTDAEPKADCLAVYEWHPATTIEVVKTAQGTQAARSGLAAIKIGCADLARGRVVLDETASCATLPEPLYLHKDVTCQVSEPRNGAKAVENWTVRATMNGRRLTLPGSFQVATSGPKK
jgi:hypothetical protein